MVYIVEKIVQNYKKNQSILFCQNTNQLFMTKLPSYPIDTKLVMGEDGFFHVEEGNVLQRFDAFFSEAYTMDLKKLDDLFHIAYTCGKNIYGIWKKNPYDLLKFKKQDESEIVNIIDICKCYTPSTFYAWREEVKQVTLHSIEYLKLQTGSVYFSFDQVFERVNKILDKKDKGITKEELSAVINYYENDFYLDRKVITEGSILALQEDYKKESQIYYKIKSHISQKTPFPDYRATDKEELNEEQNKAVKEILKRNGSFSILTGGPGTGKTTILYHMIKNLKEFYPDDHIAMLAPTGKAAKRLKESMQGLDVYTATVHKFIGYTRSEKTFITPEVKKRIQSTKLIVIDEASMLGSILFADLLEYVDLNHTKFVLVGDIDQLPSVDAGALLRDLIRMGVPVYKLEENHRSADAQTIIVNSKRINKADTELIFNEQFSLSADNFFDHLLSLAEEENSIILSPYKKETHKSSIYNLNKIIHDANPYQSYSLKFYPGERVIVTNTKYRGGHPVYINSETGVVKSFHRMEDNTYYYTIDNGEECVDVPEADLDYGYALTIHKSQGSEYDTVYLVIPEFSEFITKKMLYTAITRAKKSVVIYSTKEIIDKIIQNDVDDGRNTFLQELYLDEAE